MISFTKLYANKIIKLICIKNKKSKKLNNEHIEEHIGTIMMIGGPGVGKSTLANLIRDPKSPEFKTGATAGQVTLEFEYAPSSLKGWMICDTMGLFDTLCSGTDNLECAFIKSKNVLIKVCFVTSPKGGRLSIEDVKIIKSVMFALPSFCSYSIIVNYCDTNTEEYKNNLIKCINEHFNKNPKLKLPENILFVPKLNDVKNFPKLNIFVEEMTSCSIEQINKIIKI